MKYIIKYRKLDSGVIQSAESNKSDLHDDVISLWKDDNDIIKVIPNDFDWSLINKKPPLSGREGALAALDRLYEENGEALAMLAAEERIELINKKPGDEL